MQTFTETSLPPQEPQGRCLPTFWTQTGVKKQGSAIRALIKRKKTLLSDYSNRFFTVALGTLHTHRSEPAFSSLNRTPARASARRGDPFSQPYGSSACRAGEGVGPYFEPKGADRSVPAPAPYGSVFLVNRSITTRARFGKRLCSPSLRPPRMLSGPENLRCRAAFIQLKRAVDPRNRRRFPSPTRF
jgi:hypothetical protein